jgi:hypothetical protein
MGEKCGEFRFRKLDFFGEEGNFTGADFHGKPVINGENSGKWRNSRISNYGIFRSF